MTMPKPKTGVPRGDVSDEVKLMLLEPEVNGFDIRSEAAGTFSVTPLASSGSATVMRTFLPKGTAVKTKKKRTATSKATRKSKTKRPGK
jgi:hypothetical protein